MSYIRKSDDKDDIEHIYVISSNGRFHPESDADAGSSPVFSTVF